MQSNKHTHICTHSCIDRFPNQISRRLKPNRTIHTLKSNKCPRSTRKSTRTLIPRIFACIFKDQKVQVALFNSSKTKTLTTSVWEVPGRETQISCLLVPNFDAWTCDSTYSKISRILTRGCITGTSTLSPGM